MKYKANYKRDGNVFFGRITVFNTNYSEDRLELKNLSNFSFLHQQFHFSIPFFESQRFFTDSF